MTAMPKGATALDDDDAALALTSRAPTRERFKAALQRRYSPRIHMSLMLAASGMSAMLTSSTLLGMGVHSMLVRYPIAIALAYATFLVGVWVWLRIMGYVDNGGHRRNAKGSGDGIDLPDLGSGGGSSGGAGSGGGGSIFRGGGGSFDGGGASQSFAGGRASFVSANVRSGSGSSSSGKGGGSLFDGLDGDGIVLLLLALALVAAIFFTSGYLIWAAPDVLTEAAFGAALSGTLVRATKRNTPDGWIGGVVRKTWWPFAVVMVVALVFTGYAATFTPEPSTFREAVALALKQ
jgi:hypothetical protein